MKTSIQRQRNTKKIASPNMPDALSGIGVTGYLVYQHTQPAIFGTKYR